ncbi:MAG: hypothetical protein KDE27_24690 [Planctomycetes bacterium]|nr:hypothetical protein [Planctomycetota bacterium]
MNNRRAPRLALLCSVLLFAACNDPKLQQAVGDAAMAVGGAVAGTAAVVSAPVWVPLVGGAAVVGGAAMRLEGACRESSSGR